jgi:hypothetical protein
MPFLIKKPDGNATWRIGFFFFELAARAPFLFKT